MFICVFRVFFSVFYFVLYLLTPCNSECIFILFLYIFNVNFLKKTNNYKSVFKCLSKEIVQIYNTPLPWESQCNILLKLRVRVISPWSTFFTYILMILINSILLIIMLITQVNKNHTLNQTKTVCNNLTSQTN